MAKRSRGSPPPKDGVVLSCLDQTNGRRASDCKISHQRSGERAEKRKCAHLSLPEHCFVPASSSPRIEQRRYVKRGTKTTVGTYESTRHLEDTTVHVVVGRQAVLISNPPDFVAVEEMQSCASSSGRAGPWRKHLVRHASHSGCGHTWTVGEMGITEGMCTVSVLLTVDSPVDAQAKRALIGAAHRTVPSSALPYQHACACACSGMSCIEQQAPGLGCHLRARPVVIWSDAQVRPGRAHAVQLQPSLWGWCGRAHWADQIPVCRTASMQNP
ncbi:hypothetical protein DM02DRAFT_622852 [Periconia macrospinosa]|uniref:Uncharacterized protein n=1 Tax=Periconia macrospinosa TaxID=97972 RepID=A0A2V1E9D2_9PLEO|nr:hypothetical protein DM02DRAFT_622852 [Periconia macrospinosa]